MGDKEREGGGTTTDLRDNNIVMILNPTCLVTYNIYLRKYILGHVQCLVCNTKTICLARLNYTTTSMVTLAILCVAVAAAGEPSPPPPPPPPLAPAPS
jgi:hypothetical protein